MFYADVLSDLVWSEYKTLSLRITVCLFVQRRLTSWTSREITSVKSKNAGGYSCSEDFCCCSSFLTLTDRQSV